MANIFRLRQGKPKDPSTKNQMEQALGFFITQDNKEGEDPFHQNVPLPFTKSDFLEVLKTLEENNIFMFHNI
jgi:hypothetical protein